MGWGPFLIERRKKGLDLQAKWKQPVVWLCVLGILLGLADILRQPTLFVVAGTDRIVTASARPNTKFSIRFIHSVQKTPVLENLAVDEDGQGFRLDSTKYQSFGVGLPFLESEGNFQKEGDYYVIDGMNRHYHDLTLRTGVGTKLTLFIGDKTYPLYETYKPGTPIHIFISPLWKGMLL